MKNDREFYGNKIFKIKLRWRLFLTLGVILMTPLFIYVGMIPFLDEKVHELELRLVIIQKMNCEMDIKIC